MKLRTHTCKEPLLRNADNGTEEGEIVKEVFVSRKVTIGAMADCFTAAA